MDFVSHVKDCIALAEKKQSQLTEEIALWHNYNPYEGMSTPRIRHLFNNLLNKKLASKHGISNTNYLEIGTWKGSTAVPALYKNDVDNYWLIDDFSQFNGGVLGNPYSRLLENFQTYLNIVPNLIQQDSFAVNCAEHNIRDVNFYFYDGEHNEYNQYRALTYFLDSMADEFVFIVDDYDGVSPKKGTEAAIQQLTNENKINVKYAKYLTSGAPVPGTTPDVESWYCGIFIAVIEKVK